MDAIRNTNIATRLILPLLATLLLSACATTTSPVAEEFSRVMQDSGGTLRSYSKTGEVVDNISGSTVHIAREKLPDGPEYRDIGSMMRVQMGTSVVRHVNSTATLVENGITILNPAEQDYAMESITGGKPWLNKFIKANSNVFEGAAMVAVVSTRDNIPVGVFAGEKMEFAATEVPDSSAIRVIGSDGKTQYALIYRANIVIYDIIRDGTVDTRPPKYL